MQFRRTIGAGLVGMLAWALPALSQAQNSLDEAIEILGSNQPTARIEAAEEIADMGRAAQKAVPALIKALDTKDVSFRTEVIFALGHLGEVSAPAVPDLIKQLGADEPPLLRQAAVESLRAIGPSARAAIPQFQALLKDKDAALQVGAARGLLTWAADDAQLVRECVAVLLKGLESDREEVQIEAMHGLTEAGAPAVLPVIDVLKSTKDIDVQTRTCEVLGMIGPDARLAAPEFIKLLHAKNADVRAHAALALGMLQSDSDQSVKALVPLLRDQNERVAQYAVIALGRFGPAAASAVPALIPLFEAEDDALRASLAYTMGEIGPNAKAAIPALIVALHDNNEPVMLNAADALSNMGAAAVPALLQALQQDEDILNITILIFHEMGAEAREAVPALTEMTQDDDPEIAGDAMGALGAIGPGAKDAIPALVKILKAKDSELRPAAAAVLGQVGAKSAIEDLKKTLLDKDDDLLPIASAEALARLAPDDKELFAEALKTLEEGVANEDALVRANSLHALAELGPPAKSATPAIVKALHDAEREVVLTALDALTAIHPDDPKAIDALSGLAGDFDSELRVRACHVLGLIGAPAREAIPALKPVLQSADEAERTVAAWALVQIDPQPEFVKAALPLMIHASRNSDPEVRVEAIETLEKIGHGDPHAEAALKHAKEDLHHKVKQAAEKALKQHATKKGP
jgi:HEAT repeat protein